MTRCDRLFPDPPPRIRSPRLARSRGFTIIELMTVVTVLGGLAAMAVARTQYTVEQAKIARAIGDIRALQSDIVGYQAAGQVLPATLTDVDRAGLLDPWGRPYVYENLTTGGAPRTDVFGVPLNTEFDVYSLGPDGASGASLTAGPSQDDVVRGSDGSFIGRASRY